MFLLIGPLSGGHVNFREGKKKTRPVFFNEFLFLGEWQEKEGFAKICFYTFYICSIFQDVIW